MKKNKSSNGGQPFMILVNDIHIDKQKGELVKDLFVQVIHQCEEYGVNRIAIGGDVFTNRSGQPLDCLSTFQDIIDLCAKADIELHVIPGNHDKTDPNDERSYLDVYRGNRNLKIYRHGVSRIIEGCVVAFIPYFGDEKWMEEFEGVSEITEAQLIDGDVSKDAARFLITHIAINGVKNNDGSEVMSDLKDGMFRDYDKVLVGHYHNASRIGQNVYYTGSMYQNNFGETIDDKGCTLMFTNGTIQPIALRFPKYLKHVIDVNDGETLRNLIDKYDGETYDHIRFVIQGKKTDASKVDLPFIESKGIQCQFESVEEKEAVDNSVDKNVLNYDKRSVKKDFIKFCADNDIRGKKMKYGMTLIDSI